MSVAAISNESILTSYRLLEELSHSLLHPIASHQHQARANRLHIMQVLPAQILYRFRGFMEVNLLDLPDKPTQRKRWSHTQQDCPIDMFELQDGYPS